MCNNESTRLLGAEVKGTNAEDVTELAEQLLVSLLETRLDAAMDGIGKKVFLVRHAESEENVHMAATLGAVSRMFKFERLPTPSERAKFGKLCSSEDRDAKLSELGTEQVEDVRAQVSCSCLPAVCAPVGPEETWAPKRDLKPAALLRPLKLCSPT